METSLVEGRHEPPFEVLLINSHDASPVKLGEEAFGAEWRWHRTVPGWEPGDPLPLEPACADGMVVFAPKHQESRVSQLCDRIRATPELSGIPLLVAVDQYQMPLANQERTKPNTDFIVIPLEPESLKSHLQRARNNDETITGEQR